MKTTRPGVRLLIRLLFVLGYLILLDIVLNSVFRYPHDPAKHPPTAFQQYFEYGRSVEGKFAMLNDVSATHGWIGGIDDGPSLISQPHVNEELVTFYGMSHTEDLASSFSRNSAGFAVRIVMAPGATPNWSFAAYQKDRIGYHSRVVILGVMTLGVPYMTSTSGATMHFDASYPYTYPRYLIEGDELNARWPPFCTAHGFAACFHDASRWREYRNWLRTNDGYYDPLLFSRSFLDNSSLVRLLRRAYATNMRSEKFSNVYTSDGFVEGSEEVAVLKRIVAEFARTARDDGSLPVIYIINNQGCRDDLLRILMPVLKRDRIPYLSTDKLCPPDNPSSFKPGTDGHFTEGKNMELAQSLLSILVKELDEHNKIR
jgi:hypothetical protein